MTEEQDVTTTLNISAKPDNPSLEEQAAQMQSESQTSENPIPEKFRNTSDPVAAMAQAYAELERKQSTPMDQDLSLEKKEGMQDLTTEYLQELGQEYQENGGLKEETLNELSKRGITKDVVDIFINAQVSSANASRQQSLNDAGVDNATWQSMSDWAARNWSEDQVTEWNELAASPNALARKLAVTNLKEAWETDGRGRQPARIDGNPVTGSFTAFRSDAEMLEAMKDPRYDKDSAYRGDVDRRIELMLRANNRM